ncbi:TPMT family class I SAM-dependent methyltransferase [Saprospiraceae bacterium]|nr:TPMT family class I SAM-dependent methyltransferase [Saprospiraceae bacterium]
MDELEKYWKGRYDSEKTGWDIGYPSTPLKEYFDQLENKDISILIPGAGNAYEAAYLWNQGFKNVHIIDIVAEVIDSFLNNNPSFPKENAHHGDFFKHDSDYDLIIEQTFFCSFPPLKETRMLYAKKMASLLVPAGKLVGLWFNFPLKDDMEKRPFGGAKEEYLSYFSPHFSLCSMEECYNSIEPRRGSELWGTFTK